MVSKAGHQKKKAKMKLHKLDIINIKHFCASMDMIKKMKREPQNETKIANHIFD